MADAFPNVEKEEINKNIKKSIDSILESVNKHWEANTVGDTDKVLESISKYWKSDTDIGEDVFSIDRSYINALPKTYKDKTLRYIDVFRDHPELVQDYLTAIKEFGTEKRALEAGSTAELLHPNKLLTKVLKDPAYEKDAKRFFMVMNPLQGDTIYDLSLRQDDVGLLKQKEYEDKFSTKIVGGVTDAFQGTVRELTKSVASLVDMGLNTQSLAYIEANWPEAEKSEEGLRGLTKDLAQFGIDVWAGGKILKGFGWIDGIVKKINNINKTLKLPHMGWNQIEFKKDFSLFSGIENQSHMYFVHSYEFLTKQKDCIVATTNYGNSIIVAVAKDNIFGTQFHPEKSQKNGLKLLENFLKWEI